MPKLERRASWNVAKLVVSYRRPQNPSIIRDAEDAASCLHESWDQDLIDIQEQIAALYLSIKGEVLGYRLISSGKLNTANLDTALLLSCGLLVRAHSLILAHNHPSGDPSPSRTDIRTTLQVCKAAELVGMELYDHIILARDLRWHSMAEEGNFLPLRMMKR